MILLIDNYDSFTFNIYQMIASKTQVVVFRNDKVTIETIQKLNPAGIIISPGPGSPKDAGISSEVVKRFAGVVPILGVCLGHQVIGECFGARVVHAKSIYHGMRSRVDLLEAGKRSPLYKCVPDRFFAGRYHSLVVEKTASLQGLEIAAVSEDDEVMSILNDELKIYGIQFHPESILTPDGGKDITKLFRFVLWAGEKKMLKEALEVVTAKRDLDYGQVKNLLDSILEGELDEMKFGAFLAALKTKGETKEEISAFVDAFYEKAQKIEYTHPKTIDTCGTGGDGKGTFNISTASAIVLSCFDLKVAKHGNRSITSNSGSADILENLGIDIQAPPQRILEGLEKHNFAFLFAPKYHPATKKVATVRKSLGIRTVFNILGPLLNPVSLNYQVVGAFDFEAQEKIASVLKGKRKRAAIIHSLDGLDEISVSQKTRVLELQGDNIKEYYIDPKEYGIEYTLDDIKGYTPQENAKIFRSILNGEVSAYYWAVVLNSAFALYIAEVANDIEEGIALCQSAIKKGDAMLKLKDLQQHYKVGGLKKVSVLEKILEVKKKEVEKCKQLVPVEKNEKKLAIEKCTSTSCENKFGNIFKKENFCIIGEIKRASPSEGIISENVDVKGIAKLYESLGFFAISVLTEKNFFKGSEQDLMDVRSVTSLPVLRKDFIIDIWQLYQTKMIGADAALLITKALGNKQLSIFIKVLEILDIVPLVEVENEYEIEKALNCGAKLIGINNRNLNDLTIDIRKTERLLKYIPKDVVVISESGIKSREDFEYIRSLGVDGCLIGTSFMKTQNPVEIIGERI